MPSLDLNSSAPLYKQLADIIREDILRGHLKADQQIPTEFELNEQYQVSRSTVRKAIESLVEDGLLVKIHGKGTFVAPPQIKHRRSSFYSSTKSMEMLGKSVTSRVLDAGLAIPDKSAIHFFNCEKSDEKVICVRRLRFLDNSPLCLETLNFPMKYLTILEEDFSRSLYEILEEKYRLFPTDGERNIEICYATEEEARLLSVPRQTALMLIKDYAQDQNGIPLYISKQVHAGEMIKYGIAPVQLYKLKTEK